MNEPKVNFRFRDEDGKIITIQPVMPANQMLREGSIVLMILGIAIYVITHFMFI